MPMFICLSVAIYATSYLFHCTQRTLLEPSSQWQQDVCGLRTWTLWTLIHRLATVYYYWRPLIFLAHRGDTLARCSSFCQVAGRLLLLLQLTCMHVDIDLRHVLVVNCTDFALDNGLSCEAYSVRTNLTCVIQTANSPFRMCSVMPVNSINAT